MTASTTPQEAYGIQITWAAHDIGYIVGGSYSGISMDTVDLSSHDSANDFKEYGAAMLDGGELTIEVRFIPGDTTGQKFMRADVLARTQRQVVLTFPDATTFTFTGLCTKYGDFTLDKDGELNATLVIKVSGKPTFSED